MPRRKVFGVKEFRPEKVLLAAKGNLRRSAQTKTAFTRKCGDTL